MPWASTKQARWGHSPAGIKALGGKGKVAEWDSATPKGSLKKKKKAKIVVNNHMRAFGQTDTKTKVVEINKKKHKGDKRELADTIKHELLHVKHPKMHEKTVYKKTKKEIPYAEQQRLIAKLRTATRNQKVGAIKRKLHINKGVATKPGDLIAKMNSQKAKRTAIMGAV